MGTSEVFYIFWWNASSLYALVQGFPSLWFGEISTLLNFCAMEGSMPAMDAQSSESTASFNLAAYCPVHIHSMRNRSAFTQ